MRARINQFLTDRVLCITPHPATFLSLGLVRPEAVCQELRDRNIQLPSHREMSQLEVVQKLIKHTNMAELLSEWREALVASAPHAVCRGPDAELAVTSATRDTPHYCRGHLQDL